MNYRDIHFRMLWACLALAITLLISGGSILYGQLQRDMEGGQTREVKIAKLEEGHEEFIRRMVRFETKLDRIMDILLSRK